MASLSLLLLAALLHAAQALPAGRIAGRGLESSMGGAVRQRRDLRNLSPYEDRMMSYPVSQRGGGDNNPYHQSNDWRGQGLDDALQRLVERDQRRAQEEQRAAYLAALLRLLSEAEGAGLVGPDDVKVVEEEEDEQGTPGDFQDPAPLDYDDTGRGLSMGRPPAAWWGLLEPQLAQALLDRRLVARLLSSLGPDAGPLMSSGRRARRDVSTRAAESVSPAHRRTRRAIDDLAPPSPTNDPPLLRVKRVEDDVEEEKLRLPAAGLQRMKRIDTMATAAMEELHHGSHRRRRRAALNYDPQILMEQILEYMRE